MADKVSKQKRSEMMAGIKGKNTRPEMLVRKGLHRSGFRFLLHDKRLPGKPDLVLPKYKAVIFVNGCFWHGHDCHLFKWPSTRADFWRNKIEGNRANDEKTLDILKQTGWRIMTIWECALKAKTKKPLDEVIKITSDWLKTDSPETRICGNLRMDRKSA
jgi:DNA mismatch endonuclease (patch repair protein)